MPGLLDTIDAVVTDWSQTPAHVCEEVTRLPRVPTPVPQWPSRVPLLLLVLVIGVSTALPEVPFLVTVPAAVLLVVTLGLTRTRRAEPRIAEQMAFAASACPLLVSAIVVPALLGDRYLLGAALGTLVLTLSVLVVFVPRLFWLLLGLQGVVMIVYVELVRPTIDVSIFMSHSLAGLLSGRNPYSMTFPSPYPANETALFWAPEYITGDRINIGFPYLPGALVGDLPGHVLGDHRYASVLALLITSAMAWRLTSERVGRFLVASLAGSPLALLTVVSSWVEPLLLMAVMFLVWSFARGRSGVAVTGVVVLLTVKQYALVFLPLERLLRRRLGWKPILVGTGIATVLVGGFLVLDPSAFWRSVVELQFKQPYRADSLSLGVDLVNAGLPISGTALSIMALVAGLAASFWVRFTAPTTACWLALGIGCSLLATVLLSKQAFVNYYLLIHGCFVIATVTWPRELQREIQRGP